MKKFCPTKKFKKLKQVTPAFTLVELLIVISITTILFSLGVAQYMRFNRQQILDQSVLELKTNLTQARNMALAGKKTCGGVDSVFDGILVQFDGVNETYTISSSCNDKTVLEQIGDTYQFPQGVRIEENPEDILLKSLTGGTDQDSDETITLSLPGVGSAGVQVTPSGKIELVSATPPPPPPARRCSRRSSPT